MAKNTIFPANPNRIDPYKNFRFRVKWDGKDVAGFSKVSTLDRDVQPVKFRSGDASGDPSPMPGQMSYEPICLARGITQDPGFAIWCNRVWDYHNSSPDDQGDAGVTFKDFRKDIIIEVNNEAGDRVLSYTVYRCWPSEYVAMPELDGVGDQAAIQSLTLQNEGWERDTSVGEADA